MGRMWLVRVGDARAWVEPHETVPTRQGHRPSRACSWQGSFCVTPHRPSPCGPPPLRQATMLRSLLVVAALMSASAFNTPAAFAPKARLALKSSSRAIARGPTMEDNSVFAPFPSPSLPPFLPPLPFSSSSSLSHPPPCPCQFLRQGGKKPDSLKAVGLSDEARAAAQQVDSEAAWEAAQKKAADTGGIAVGFNPYDAETGYWLGEWICADCGYIYGSRGEAQAFETLGRWYKCPQCAGPRRRFAKKLGEK